MLFQKDIEPRCTYCSRGTQLDEEKILCPKRGLVSPGEHCRSFRYDRSSGCLPFRPPQISAGCGTRIFPCKNQRGPGLFARGRVDYRSRTNRTATPTIRAAPVPKSRRGMIRGS